MSTDSKPDRSAKGDGASEKTESGAFEFKYTPWFYRFVQAFLRRVAFPFWFRSYSVKYHQTIPEGEPVALFFNHVSNWDPAVVGALVPRRLNYPAKKELFDEANLFKKIVAKVLYGIGTVPFDRENPVNSRDILKYLMDLLDLGEGLAFAPEGTRNETYFQTGEMLPFKTGFLKVILSKSAKSVRKGGKPVKCFPAFINYHPDAGYGSRLMFHVGREIPIDEYVQLTLKGKKDQAAELLSDRIRGQMELLSIRPPVREK